MKCVPKVSGSRTSSLLEMLVPADGVKAIKRFVLDSIVGAGGRPVPPGIVGVGIGGSADLAIAPRQGGDRAARWRRRTPIRTWPRSRPTSSAS